MRPVIPTPPIRIFLANACWILCTTVRAQHETYPVNVGSLLERFCYECHQGDEAEAEIDLAGFESIEQIRSATEVWQRVRRVLGSRQMPPPETPQPTDPQFELLNQWVVELLRSEAIKRSGDPGPVTLRRLSNAEYTYSIRDLTGIDHLDPAKEFPVDGAAGEGFNNTGDALGMSPAMVTKYLDAAKEISQHVVLTPQGVRFSASTSDRDWTDATLERIRNFYFQYADSGGSYLDWQGENANAPRNGRIPIDRYIQALITHREALQSESVSLDAIAPQHDLSPKYLRRLSSFLNGDDDQGFVLNEWRQRWRTSTDVDSLIAEIQRWQQSLWQFHSIGHLGRKGAPKHWMTPRDPLVDRQQLTLDLASQEASDSVMVYLTAHRVAGDDATVAWRRPRIEAPGRPPVLLRDAADVAAKLADQRVNFLANLASYLTAASQVGAGADPQTAIISHRLNRSIFDRLLGYLGIGANGPPRIDGLFDQRINEVGGHPFVNGWGSPNTPSIVANSSDQAVRIPGHAGPHSVVVHPAPTQYVAIGWRSPVSGLIELDAQIADAHPECGNGVEWILQHRGGGRVVEIASGEFATGANESVAGKRIEVERGDFVSIAVGPRAGQHACDLTSVNLVVKQVSGNQRQWSLSGPVADRVHTGNPIGDAHGNESVWYFYHGPMQAFHESTGSVMPTESLLAQWKRESGRQERQQLAKQLQELASGRIEEIDSINATVIEQLGQLVTVESVAPEEIIADERFGRHPQSLDVPDHDLFTSGATSMAFAIPAEIAREGVLTVDVECESPSGLSAVQVEVSFAPPQSSSLVPDQPILVKSGSSGESALTVSLDRFRDMFPAALCYTKIVPVDEVVTLQLYYREDQHFKRLMCSDEQVAMLDRLWDELLYVAQEPFAAQVALEQSLQFATQDRPDLVPEFDQLKAEYQSRADAFGDWLVETEPIQLLSAIEFASGAWRRKLTVPEREKLQRVYTELRQQELSHGESIRLLIARILVAPAFLYRLEQPGTGREAVDITDEELASRISYFLWSSTPDRELMEWAERRELHTDQAIGAQVDRMLVDPKIRRLAIHFACQWLHLRDFDHTVEKNERLYPQFATQRADLYEESIRFFTDMFSSDRSILDLIASDHTFVNESVAKHYGIDGVTGSEWRRIEGMQSFGRGGVLGMATVLASQSGASRTSPILRGNWVYETLLGQRLPKPPAGIPTLPETVPSGKTARQLIELHSSADECAKCHRKIDPYGFALEQFDTIGRLRPSAVDVKTTLPDGQTIDGMEGLRDYLMRDRRDEIVHQFCRKLLGYALGREIRLSDEPLLESMRKQLEENEYRFSVAVKSIATSPQFRQIRGRLADEDSFE